MAFDLQPAVTTQTDSLRQRLEVASAERGYAHEHSEGWPAAPDADPIVALAPTCASFRASYVVGALWEADGALAQVRVQDGLVSTVAYGATPASAEACIGRVRELLPPHEASTPDVVPVTFWTASPDGGRSLRRDLDAAAWADIAGNYLHTCGLPELMSADFRPGAGGQLILWHGEPGTGKTTALRALAREWREWADLHYIVDPDTFFGHRADYMMQVLTAESSAKFEAGRRSGPRWRVLVLEDCGEMLQPDAKREVGQALARLLNACDGLIGRGLRILVLLTTNEPVEKLHEAVARPGRCAALVEFKPFSPAAASEWLRQHGAEPIPNGGMVLADLYAAAEGFREKRRPRAVGFAA